MNFQLLSVLAVPEVADENFLERKHILGQQRDVLYGGKQDFLGMRQASQAPHIIKTNFFLPVFMLTFTI